MIGLSVGLNLASSGSDVLLLEQHRRLGTETTSRNSGVIHAGLYYPPNSLRARFCVQGKALLYAFAQDNAVPVVRYGKLIVATTAHEIGALRALMENARASGVDDLVYLDANEARALEPHVRCEAACLSPSTGVIDVASLMIALEGHYQKAGGEIVLGAEVTSIAREANGNFRLSVVSDGETSELTCAHLILAAGHGTVPLAQTISFAESYRLPRHFPAKGHYYSLSGASPFRHLVYPLPQVGGLGIHVTLDTAGQARFGPDVTWCGAVDYAFDDDGGARKHRFVDAIRPYWPDVAADKLAPDYVGVRPKIYDKGEPAADFAIHGPVEHGIEGLCMLFGIESPGLTSSLAIGRHVATLMNPAKVLVSND